MSNKYRTVGRIQPSFNAKPLPKSGLEDPPYFTGKDGHIYKNNNGISLCGNHRAHISNDDYGRSYFVGCDDCYSMHIIEKGHR